MLYFARFAHIVCDVPLRAPEVCLTCPSAHLALVGTVAGAFTRITARRAFAGTPGMFIVPLGTSFIQWHRVGAFCAHHGATCFAARFLVPVRCGFV
mgnify:CR=1 FL=1